MVTSGLIFWEESRLSVSINLKSNLTTVALISSAGVAKTVTDHHPPLFQKRSDHLFDMLSPGCFVEEEFRQGSHLAMVWIEKDLSDFFTDGTSSGLSGDQHRGFPFG